MSRKVRGDALVQNKPNGYPGARCPACGKVRFPTRRSARKWGRHQYPAAKIRAYKCGNFWHFTSQDTATTTWFKDLKR